MTTTPSYTDEQVIEYEKISFALFHKGIADCLSSLREERQRLQAEVEALRPDAERYRYLLSQMQIGAVRTQLPLYRAPYLYLCEPCDRIQDIQDAIDAARTIHTETKEAKS